VNAEDENGDTPLHLALNNKKSHISPLDFDADEAPSIYSVREFVSSAHSMEYRLRLAFQEHSFWFLDL